MKFSNKVVFTGKRLPNQKRKEIINSFIASILFSLGIIGLYQLWLNGYLNIDTNTDINITRWWYHLLSLILALFIHETYYYWLHRLMHSPKVYKYIHQGHHDSIIVTAWSAFSFDWVETILQVLAFYLMMFCIPMHILSLIHI